MLFSKVKVRLDSETFPLDVTQSVRIDQPPPTAMHLCFPAMGNCAINFLHPSIFSGNRPDKLQDIQPAWFPYESLRICVAL